MIRITICFLLLVAVATCAKQIYGKLKVDCQDTDSGVGCKCYAGLDKRGAYQYKNFKTDAECKVPLEPGQKLGGLKKDCTAVKGSKGCSCQFGWDDTGHRIVNTFKNEGDCKVVLDKNGKPIPVPEEIIPEGVVH